MEHVAWLADPERVAPLPGDANLGPDATALLAVAAHLRGRQALPVPVPPPPPAMTVPGADLADVRGQQRGRRLLELAYNSAKRLITIGNRACRGFLQNQVIHRFEQLTAVRQRDLRDEA